MRRIALLVGLGLFLFGWLGTAGCAGPKRLPPVAGRPIPAAPTGPQSKAPHLVGVGLAEGRSELQLSATGGCVLLDGKSGSRLVRIEAAGALRCRLDGSSVRWSASGRSGRVRAVILQPNDPSGRVVFDGREYRGEFAIVVSPKSSGLTLVNNLDLEDYLRGVVPWEIGRHGEDKLEALAAQAVAARTYTISHLGARSDRGFDVFDTVMDQVYRGAKDEDLLCNRAIDRTRGLVLRSGGEEIEAYYSACCGGVASNIHEVWPLQPKPYLVTHPDAPRGKTPYCADYRYYNWREEWTAAQLEEILARTLPVYLDYMGQGSRVQWAGPLFRAAKKGGSGLVPGRLQDLEIVERTTSGRVARLVIRTEAGEYSVRGDRVRWVLAPVSGNPAILRSALFEVELSYRDGKLTGVAARGKGYGHGIGLCQAGALVMAERGKDFREILGHYYRGAVLRKIGGGR